MTGTVVETHHRKSRNQLFSEEHALVLCSLSQSIMPVKGGHCIEDWVLSSFGFSLGLFHSFRSFNFQFRLFPVCLTLFRCHELRQQQVIMCTLYFNMFVIFMLFGYYSRSRCLRTHCYINRHCFGQTYSDSSRQHFNSYCHLSSCFSILRCCHSM